VVDDEVDVGEMVSKIINLMGHEAVTALNGKEALQILKSKPFNIMITDVKMPEMDGFELMKAVRDQFPGTYIICMTAMELPTLIQMWWVWEGQTTLRSPSPSTK